MIRYVIIETTDVSNAHINASLSHNISETRQTNDGFKTLLSFCNSTTIAEDVFKNETWYTEDEIKVVLEDAEWQAVV